MQEKLYKAIVEKLRTDTGSGSLVELSGHDATSANGYAIGRSKPNVAERLPYLGVKILQSLPLVEGGSVTHVQRARISFLCSAESELTAIRLADRIEKLLHWKVEDDAARKPATGYYDFSNTDISTRSVRFKSRTPEPDFDEDSDVWTDAVEADVIWVSQPCPAS